MQKISCQTGLKSLYPNPTGYDGLQILSTLDAPAPTHLGRISHGVVRHRSFAQPRFPPPRFPKIASAPSSSSLLLLPSPLPSQKGRRAGRSDRRRVLAEPFRCGGERILVANAGFVRGGGVRTHRGEREPGLGRGAPLPRRRWGERRRGLRRRWGYLPRAPR